MAESPHLKACRELLTMAAHVSDALAAALAPHGISLRDMDLLAMLLETDPPTQVELGGQLRTDRSSMVAVIDRLEGAGFVERLVDPTDRRARRIHLTARGRAAAAAAAEAASSVAADLLAGMPLEYVRALAEMAHGDVASRPDHLPEGGSR